MRYWILILCFMFAPRWVYAQAYPSASQVQCTNTAIYDASTNGATKLVSGLTGKSIYICGFDFYGAGTGNVSLQEGTGTNCGTGTSTITPAFQLKTQDGIVDNPGIYTGLHTVIAGDALCINSSAGVAIQAIVYYTQF